MYMYQYMFSLAQGLKKGECAILVLSQRHGCSHHFVLEI